MIFEELNSAAFDACAAAVAAHPEDAASRYHLARVAARLGHAETGGHLEAAVAMKHPAAIRTLSLRLRASPERQKEAFDLVQAAAGAGDPMSIRGMGRRYALGVEVEADPARAVSTLAPLVQGRRGYAVDLLARIIDGGPDHPAKVAKAFQYYWQALTLIPQEGLADGDAALLDNARQRVRSLARQLPPERVVEAYRAAIAGR